jgi:hypothetical protein
MITSKSQLRTLHTANRTKTAVPVSAQSPISSNNVLRLPAPSNGVCCSVSEVASFLSIQPATVSDWCYRGVKGVKLQTLTAPRGKVAPSALCRFLSLVNGLSVEVQR